MIRWKYLGPRLLVVACIFCFLTYGVDPLLRWSLVSTGQTVTGSKVDLTSVRASLTGGSISLSGVEVADPRRPDHNLVEADELMLDLDMGSLLRQKYEVRTARLTGLKVNTDRESDGALKGSKWFDKPGGDNAKKVARWLAKLSGKLGQSILDEFETVQLAREMSKRWPREYRQLESRLEAARRRVGELKQLAQPREKNLLANVQQFANLANELEKFKTELRQLEGEIKRLSDQPQRDKSALLEARKRDEARIRKLARLATLDKQTLGQYMLGSEQAQWVGQVLEWVKWARKFAPAKTEDFRAKRSRGRDIVFDGVQQRPDFLIRAMVLSGEFPLGREDIQFRGVATGITNQPRFYGFPTVINIQTSGKAEIRVCGVLDRTKKRPVDRIVVECPHIDQHQWVLGDREQLAIIVPKASLQLRADLRLEGEGLAGRVVLNRSAPSVEPVVSQKLGGDVVAGPLAEALQGTNNIQLQVAINGTISQPTYQVQTDLGDRLAVAFKHVARAELEKRQNELAARLNREIEQYVAEFRRIVADQQNQLAKQLSLNHEEISQLTKLVGKRVSVGQNVGIGKLRLDQLLR